MKPTRTELALAGLALAFGLVSACSNGSNDMTQSGKGAVQFVMSASAATPAARAATSGGGSSDESQLQSANVTFASILARNLDGELLTSRSTCP